MSTVLKLADAGRTDLDDLVDLDRYPIHVPESAALRVLIDATRDDLETAGCCILPGFLTPAGLARARADGTALAPKATFQQRMCNLYNSAPDPALPADDPRHLYFERTSGFVTRDMVPADTAIHRLYVSPAMKRFVAACSGAEEIYEYADPFAGLVFNVLPPGTRQPWHYDTNELVTTIMTQAPESGGAFEFCPGIRTPGNENLAGVARVLRGEDDDRIRRLWLRPGDLQLFRGRYALHQVAEVAGRRARHTAVFGYANRPGVVGPLERTRQLYGRVAEIHVLADRERRGSGDGLIH